MSSLNVAVTHKKEWSAIAKSKLFIFCPLINYIQLCVPSLSRKRERDERERDVNDLFTWFVFIELPSVQSKTDAQAQPSDSSTLTGK